MRKGKGNKSLHTLSQYILVFVSPCVGSLASHTLTHERGSGQAAILFHAPTFQRRDKWVLGKQ